MRYIMLLFVAVFCGCRTMISTSDDLDTWLQSFEPEMTVYPQNATKTLKLAPHIKQRISLFASDSSHVSIDFGQGLILKVKDPQYENGWASVQLVDIDADGIKDLDFSARFSNPSTLLKAVFIFRPNEWERYLLPAMD